MTPETDPLRTAKGIVWSIPLSLALWALLAGCALWIGGQGG